MDPIANLEEQRSLTKQIFELSGSEERDEALVLALAERGERLAELVQALDEWLSKGGFLPDAWKPKERTNPLVEDLCPVCGRDYHTPAKDCPNCYHFTRLPDGTPHYNFVKERK